MGDQNDVQVRGRFVQVVNGGDDRDGLRELGPAPCQRVHEEGPRIALEVDRQADDQLDPDDLVLAQRGPADAVFSRRIERRIDHRRRRHRVVGKQRVVQPGAARNDAATVPAGLQVDYAAQVPAHDRQDTIPAAARRCHRVLVQRLDSEKKHSGFVDAVLH